MTEKIQHERQIDYILIVLVCAFWMLIGLEACTSSVRSKTAETSETLKSLDTRD